MFPRLESHLHWIWSELCAHLQPWGLFDLWAPVSTNWESATPKTYVTWCFDLPFARSVQDSYSISPSSYLDVHLLCLTPQHKPICHTLRLNHLKLGPWKFPASTLSSRQSNLFLLEGRLDEVILFSFKATRSRVTRSEILVRCSQVHAVCVRADISGSTVVFVHGLCIDDM